jgi:hypothetical protein
MALRIYRYNNNNATISYTRDLKGVVLLVLLV